MGRPRAEDDREPKDTPVYAEPEAIRFELPVVIAGVKGCLVIRWFTGQTRRFSRGAMACPDDGEASIRGKAAEFMERFGR